MSNYQIRFVKHGSAECDKVVALRYKILREPLRLNFTAEQLAAEDKDLHLACFDGDKVVGCIIVILYEGGKLKMRQVAVDEPYQRSGIGRKMTEFLEQWMLENNYHYVYCHARDVAKEFYLKQGYKVVGDEFEEVTIKHFYMEKTLT